MDNDEMTGSATAESEYFHGFGRSVDEAQGFPPLTFEAAEFMCYVADEGMTEEQAQELLRAVWEIMVAFVDMAFGIHPIQQAVDGFGQQPGSAPTGSSPVLSCTDAFSEHCNTTAIGRAAREPGREED